MRVPPFSLPILSRAILPALVYFVCFVLLTYPLITTFSTELWTGSPDGWQMLWSFWWVQEALTNLHQSPFHTFFIHYPYGISLWTHALTLFNSMSALALSPFLSLLESYNLLLLLSFVLGGLTAFWLAFAVTRAYTPSLIAGYLFTFSFYHFAHARAHLNLTAIQWLPLFVLCWYLFLQKPSRRLGAAVALALWLVTLCDYYYLFYCVLAAVVMTVWWGVKTRAPFFLITPAYRTPFAVLCAVVLVTTMPLVVPLGLAILNDPVQGHTADLYSLDLTALILPGRNWRYAALTRDLWVPLGKNYAENNVALGPVTILLAGYALWNWRKLAERHVWLWVGLSAIFGIFALGPALRFNGQVISPPVLPYAILNPLPGFSMSGVPVRMVVMLSLFTAVLVALAFMRLLRGPPLGRLLGVVAFALIVLELFPRSLPSTPPKIPAYVEALKALPNDAGVLDWAGLDPKEHWDKGIPPGEMMWYQVIHEKPIAFGYTSRVPESTARQDADLLAVVYAERFDLLCTQYHIRYVAVGAKQDLGSGAIGAQTITYRDPDAIIYDLGQEGDCRARK